MPLSPHRGATLLLSLGLLGCQPEVPPPVCEGPVAHRYDPSHPELLAWPDDALLVEDEAGVSRVRIAEAPWVTALPPVLGDILRDVDGQPGFARQGAIVLRFTDDVGEGLAGVVDQPSLDDPLLLLDLSGDTPRPLPFEATVEDFGRQLRVQPLVTLASGARHTLVLRDHWAPPAGGCVAPASTALAGLNGEGAPHLAGVAEQLDLHPHQISALTVFTTHDEARAVRAVADALVARGARWEGPADCVADQGGRRCTRYATVYDARDADGAVRRGESATPWQLAVRLWLPAPSASPPPVLMYGHGLGGHANEASGGVRSRIVGELGFAMVAVDALAHGEHPTSDGSDLAALQFLGLNLTGSPLFSPDALQGHFLQTMLDRVQVLELVRSTPDLDGDGVDDHDGERVAYWGISLGGLLGAGVLALGDHADAGVLSIAGGQLIQFATASGDAGFIQPVLLGLVGDDEAALARLLAVGQTAVDAADPATLGAHVLRDRLGERQTAIDLLLPVSVFDTTVPPPTGRALARGIALPHLPPAYEPVPPLVLSTGVEHRGNFADRSAGFFQYDRITDAAGRVVRSTHNNLPFSAEGLLQSQRFFADWAETGQATIVDPYAELETPPLR